MSGHWPPEWEDPDDGYSDAGLPDAPFPDAGHSDLELAEVTSFLASVRSPALPASFEARISAAIAADAAARATTSAEADATEAAGAPMSTTGAEDAKDTVRSSNREEVSQAAAVGGPATSADRKPRRASRSSPATGPRGTRPDGRRRRLRMPSAQASGWLIVCCLVIAGFGYIFSHASMSSSSSSADASGSAAQPAAASAGTSAGEHKATETTPERTNLSEGLGAQTGFLYVKSGTSYQASALASQVQGEVGNVGALYAGGGGSLTPSASAPVSPPSATPPVMASASASAASTSGAVGHRASPALEGCVAAVTHGAKPSLVDEASYDGTPAYIIAVPTEAWVVGRGCTATDTDVIRHVPLNG